LAFVNGSFFLFKKLLPTKPYSQNLLPVIL
jgi:hypothetical protein